MTRSQSFDSSITREEKAQETLARFDTAWVGNPLSFEHAAGRIELREKPVLRRREDSAIMGVSFYDVHLFDAQGREIRVDPTRHIINVPQVPRSNLTYEQEVDPVTGFIIMRRVVGNASPLEAAWEALGDSLISMPNAARWGTRGTVTTVYATAPGGDGTGYGQSSTYATARTTYVNNIDSHRVGQLIISGVNYRCQEADAIFDTSGLPDTDTVSDVVASFDGATDASDTDFTVVLAASSYDGGIVDSGDWVSGASLSALTTYATWATSGYSSSYNAFTSEAAMLVYINKTGSTAFKLYSSRHSNGDVPTGDEYVSFTDADAAGTTTDPKLDITHAAGGGGATAAGAWIGRGGWW